MGTEERHLRRSQSASEPRRKAGGDVSSSSWSSIFLDRAGILIGSFTMFFILGLYAEQCCLALLNKKGWYCFSL